MPTTYGSDGVQYSLDNHKSNPAAFVSDNNWPTLLLPLVENQESVFWCIDDTRTQGPLPGARQRY